MYIIMEEKCGMTGIFKDDSETKRVIFNVRMDLAERLEQAKKEARQINKKLDVDSAIDKCLEKYLKKAEKKIADMLKKQGIDPDADGLYAEGEAGCDPDESSFQS